MTSYSTFQDLVGQTRRSRYDFFRLVFDGNEGYICIAYKGKTDLSFTEKFFEFPGELDAMLDDINEMAVTLTHVYFCPQLFTDKDFKRPGGKSARVKENVKTCPVLWADLDQCNPQDLQVPASIVVQSSSGRWQSYWRMEKALPPEEAEAICMKIAYYHANQGADRSGWDLTQLMRVPYTPNYKYGDLVTAPIVTVIKTDGSLYRKRDFDVYPSFQALKFLDNPLPDEPELPSEDPLDILQRYRPVLHPSVFSLYTDVPEEGQDWSTTQWKLVKLCVEAGLKPEETFVVTRSARCNKYARDGRPESALWIEVKKAYVKEYETHNLVPTPTFVIPELITDEEVLIAQSRETFIERYIKWACDLTDAAPQYHQAGAFTVLSAILSGTLRLHTSFGTVIPNLWFMILADTTLTRKTTAMNIAMNLLGDVNPDAIMATDGSAEGILSAMKDRAKKPSIYLRDEFTGLLESITHKDYMAGMAEQLTKLYDGQPLKRLLRKEEIKINDPIFILFAGGVKTKTQDLLTEEHINSGFIPRFVFITAVADRDRVRPVGPPITHNLNDREKIKDELMDMYVTYNTPRMITLPNASGTAHIAPEFEASLTPEAWLRYNEFETTLTHASLDSGITYLTPIYDRLAKSTLKAAMLIAASRQGENGSVVVELADLLHAIYYCRQWHVYVSEIVGGIGKSPDERMMDKIIEFVTRHGAHGASRSDIMRMFKLDSKRTELLMTTITQRRLLLVTTFQGQPRYVGNE